MSSKSDIWTDQYSAFGKVMISVSDVTNNFRFPGQYLDGETGLYYNFHRYYDAEIGRYFREEPIGLRGEINLFVYVSNSPINSTDQFGESFLIDCVKFLYYYWQCTKQALECKKRIKQEIDCNGLINTLDKYNAPYESSLYLKYVGKRFQRAKK